MVKERGRELGAGAIALLAHVLFLSVAPRAPAPGAEPLPPRVEPSADTTVDIEEENPPGVVTRAPAPEQAPTPEAARVAVRAPAPVPAPAPESAPAPAPESAPAPAPAPESAPAPAPEPAPAPTPAAPSPPVDEYGGAPAPAPVVGALPGLGSPVWAVPGVVPGAPAARPAPTTIEAPRPVDSDIASRVIAGTLHNKDKSTGIDVPAAGVVASTIASAVRGSAVKDARATFEVKLDAQGKVEGVRLVSTTDANANHWTGVVEAVKSGLSARSLQMGPDKQGVTVVVKIESKVQYPAGSVVKGEIRPLCANEVIEQIAQAVQDGMSAGGGGYTRGVRDDTGRFIPYSDLDEERKRRFCIPIGIVGGGDLSNFGGAHMYNVVSSSFTIKRAGEQALPADTPLPVDRSAPWTPAAPGKTRPPPPPKKKKKKKRT
ncbi:hypothetical protein [Polyangium fumosum]|uniref:Uncharacterized protein n=1 Tax=Polyangium fumosum TaxID=889272 RepID=A0A4V5PKP3_9BACT|nr:hypothetical protein [Polyangium fumosum]TKC96353.1 hypothetical protein E8A74_45950 [Polyangium fumosum]